jgi:hypothetical protein
LIELYDCISECLWVASFHSFNQGSDELRLPCTFIGRVLVGVLCEVSFR